MYPSLQRSVVGVARRSLASVLTGSTPGARLKGPPCRRRCLRMGTFTTRLHASARVGTRLKSRGTGMQQASSSRFPSLKSLVARCGGRACMIFTSCACGAWRTGIRTRQCFVRNTLHFCMREGIRVACDFRSQLLHQRFREATLPDQHRQRIMRAIGSLVENAQPGAKTRVARELAYAINRSMQQSTLELRELHVLTPALSCLRHDPQAHCVHMPAS